LISNFGPFKEKAKLRSSKLLTFLKVQLQKMPLAGDDNPIMISKIVLYFFTFVKP